MSFPAVRTLILFIAVSAAVAAIVRPGCGGGPGAPGAERSEGREETARAAERPGGPAVSQPAGKGTQSAQAPRSSEVSPRSSKGSSRIGGAEAAREGRLHRAGPRREFKSIQQAQPFLLPGDTLLVDGGAVYAGGVIFVEAGTAELPITICGISARGERPVIDGGRNVVEFNGDHYIFEGFEIRNAGFRGLYHHADDITIRDCVVHDCPHGILGADQGSGSVTIEYCEVFRCGEGEGRHQIYISTNEDDYPGSVFRLQFCHIHDGTGGENVKSRAERSEIYYNLLENPYHHNLELIGPDPAGGVAEGAAREDADVVGNVFIARRFSRNVRVGGDGTGQSFGRYRFMNNTFIHLNEKPASHIFPHFGVESVEMHNNVFYIASGTVLDDSRARWANGRRVSGSNNWVHSRAVYPREWIDTVTGTDPGLAGLSEGLFRPATGSALIDAGSLNIESPAGSPFQSPLLLPAFHPPEGRIAMPGGAEPRAVIGAIDIGAFEFDEKRGAAQSIPKPSGRR